MLGFVVWLSRSHLAKSDSAYDAFTQTSTSPLPSRRFNPPHPPRRSKSLSSRANERSRPAKLKGRPSSPSRIRRTNHPRFLSHSRATTSPRSTTFRTIRSSLHQLRRSLSRVSRLSTTAIADLLSTSIRFRPRLLLHPAVQRLLQTTRSRFRSLCPRKGRRRGLS